MSNLHFNLVRCVSTIQVSSWDENDSSVAFPLHNVVYLIETVSCGWTSGARLRVKRFRNIQEYLAYLNKLSSGGWISEDSYTSAWQLGLDLNEVVEARFPEAAQAVALWNRNLFYKVIALRKHD